MFCFVGEGYDSGYRKTPYIHFIGTQSTYSETTKAHMRTALHMRYESNCVNNDIIIVMEVTLWQNMISDCEYGGMRPLWTATSTESLLIYTVASSLDFGLQVIVRGLVSQHAVNSLYSYHGFN